MVVRTGLGFRSGFFVAGFFVGGFSKRVLHSGFFLRVFRRRFCVAVFLCNVRKAVLVVPRTLLFI